MHIAIALMKAGQRVATKSFRAGSPRWTISKTSALHGA